jgi:hypothetical protein
LAGALRGQHADHREHQSMIVIQDIVPLQDGLTRTWHNQPDPDFGAAPNLFGLFGSLESTEIFI